MKAFEVSINGKAICIAGLKGPGVVSLHVNRILGVSDPPEEERLSFSAGCLDSLSEVHANWGDMIDLEIGSEIVIRVIECDEATPATPKGPEVTEHVREYQEEYLLALAKHLGWTVLPPEAAQEKSPAEHS